jgi:hypothetical protein
LRRRKLEELRRKLENENLMNFLGSLIRLPFPLFCSSYLLTKRAPLKSGCERFNAKTFSGFQTLTRLKTKKENTP